MLKSSFGGFFLCKIFLYWNLIVLQLFIKFVSIIRAYKLFWYQQLSENR